MTNHRESPGCPKVQVETHHRPKSNRAGQRKKLVNGTMGLTSTIFENLQTNRKDEVRIPSAIFLGRMEGGSKKTEAAEKLKAVVLDGNNAVELRRAALRSLGASAEKSLYIGDIYSVDYLGAVNAGMYGLLLDPAGTYATTATPCIESLAELEGKLREIEAGMAAR